MTISHKLCEGKNQQGYLWTYSRPKGDVLFEWRVSRERKGPEEFLKNSGANSRSMDMRDMNPWLKHGESQ